MRGRVGASSIHDEPAGELGGEVVKEGDPVHAEGGVCVEPVEQGVARGEEGGLGRDVKDVPHVDLRGERWARSGLGANECK